MQENHIFILQQLAKHKYLTRSLFQSTGLKVSRNHFTNLMKTLTDPKLNRVGQKKFGYSPSYGKVEDIYYLKTKGKKYLIKEHGMTEEEVNLPLGSKIFSSDYFHRIQTIKIRIDLEQGLEQKGYKVLFYDQYFSGRVVPGKKGRESSTKISTGQGRLKADSIFLIESPEGKQSFYCLEYHNGQEVKRIEEQMKAYVEAMKIGSPSLKYGMTIGNRVINIFKNEQTMRCLEERMKKNLLFRNFDGYFLYLTLDQINNSILLHQIF